MKLKTKIQLFSSLFMLVLILIINTAIYFLFYKISVNSELEQLATHTDALEAALKDIETTNVLEADLLAAYLPNDGMIRVIDQHGQLIHMLTKKKEYTDLAFDFTHGEKQYIASKVAEEDVAVIARPIIWTNGDVVTLQVSKHMTILAENMRLLLYVLIFASIMILLPTIIAGNLLSRFLLRPIKELIQAMKENMDTKKWKKIDLKNRPQDELYEMEKTFNELIDKLEETFNKQEVFVSDASHELKTPISIIKGYAQLIERRGHDNPQLIPEAIEAINSETNRMQKLVEQMLLLAKSEPNMKWEKVNVRELCEQAIKTFQGVTKRPIHFDKDGAEFLVQGNKNQLQQVIYILMDNALKYSEQPIKLNLSQQENQIIITVTDYGVGMSEEDKERIFDRFYRVDKARSRETGGTGLGLSIAKIIVETHGGTISVKSVLDEGSTFKVTLPK